VGIYKHIQRYNVKSSNDLGSPNEGLYKHIQCYKVKSPNNLGSPNVDIDKYIQRHKEKDEVIDLMHTSASKLSKGRSEKSAVIAASESSRSADQSPWSEPRAEMSNPWMYYHRLVGGSERRRAHRPMREWSYRPYRKRRANSGVLEPPPHFDNIPPPQK
ncbi:hypothetical protein LSAT2_001630, partial [Lamellibrachia satsuma]